MSGSEEEKPKKRSLTSITLGWLAEKVRRADEIKKAMQEGTYKVDSTKVAQAIVNKDE